MVLKREPEILSEPAAFPGFNLRSCLDTPGTILDDVNVDIKLVIERDSVS